LQTSESAAATSVGKEVTSSEPIRCTGGCTREPAAPDETAEDSLAELVATLTLEQQRRLVELITVSEEGAGS
jgi:hypothetical protein